MRKNLLWLSVMFLPLIYGYGFSEDSIEASKIQYLIGSIEAMQEVMFLRNGVEYQATQAADHLRLKLKIAGNRVKTAEDFIKLCGSKSSTTGEAYRMRFPDGTILDTEVFFRKKMKEFMAGKPCQP